MHHATTYRAQPVSAGRPCTVEVISLDGTRVLRVSQDGWLIGYFTTPDDAARAGVDLAIAIIKE